MKEEGEGRHVWEMGDEDGGLWAAEGKRKTQAEKRKDRAYRHSGDTTYA